MAPGTDAERERGNAADVQVSERTLHWFGDKTREELLVEIDRIITTDRPALASLYEERDRFENALKRIAFYPFDVMKEAAEDRAQMAPSAVIALVEEHSATDAELLEHLLRLGSEGLPLMPQDCELCAELNRRVVSIYGQPAHWDPEVVDV